MATDKKISELDLAISLTATDLVPITDSNGENKSIHGQQIKDFVGDEFLDDIQAVEDMISDEYDPERVTPYEAGDLAIYNNTLYKCLDTTSGAWDSTKWDETTIAAAVAALANVPTFDTLTTSDNNKLLSVSVSGSDISVGAVGVKQKVVSFQSSISGNSDKGYTISDILNQASVSSDKLISIEFGGARALTAWSEVQCTTWLSISGGTYAFYFHNFGTGGNAEFSFLVTYFE